MSKTLIIFMLAFEYLIKAKGANNLILVNSSRRNPEKKIVIDKYFETMLQCMIGETGGKEKEEF